MNKTNLRKKLSIAACAALMMGTLIVGTGAWAQESEAAPAPAETESSEAIGLSIALDYVSNYYWRGVYWFENDGVFFPMISYEAAGFTLSFGGEFSEDAFIDDGNSTVTDRHALDFGVDYSYSFGETATLGAGVWFFMFYNEKANNFFTGTLSLSLDTVPLTPTVSYSHDYYTDSGKKKDFYVTLAIGHEIELTKESKLELGLSSGYYYADSTDQKGISDITASAKLSVDVSSVTLSGGFNYLIVPAKDFYTYNNVKDLSRFSSSFRAAYSI
ncbi:MAG: hypothetical protein GY754_15320 [bacterium]|nr:hypothetical protein [bacterium]